MSLLVLWLGLVLDEFQHFEGLVELLLLDQNKGLQVEVVMFVAL